MELDKLNPNNLCSNNSFFRLKNEKAVETKCDSSPVSSYPKASIAGQMRFEALLGKSSILDVTHLSLRNMPGQALATMESLVSLVRPMLTDSKFSGLSEAIQNRLIHYARLIERSKDVLPESHKESFLALRKEIREILSRVTAFEKAQSKEISFKELFGDLSEEQLDALGRSIVVLQLSTGCSVKCPNCNFSALPEARRHLSWDCINEILDRWGQYFKENQVFLYYSSDPLDWQDSEGRDYSDVAKLFKEKAGYFPDITTAVPKGKEEIAKKLWVGDFGEMRISASNVNIDRLKQSGFWHGETYKDLYQSIGEPGPGSRKIERHTGLNENDYVDNRAQLYSPAGVAYDYKSMVASIGCVTGVYITPDGVSNFASTETTPLNPNGFVSFPINSETKDFFLAGYTFDEGRLNFFPYYVRNIEDAEKLHLDHLTDDQCLGSIFEQLSCVLLKKPLMILNKLYPVLSTADQGHLSLGGCSYFRNKVEASVDLKELIKSRDQERYFAASAEARVGSKLELIQKEMNAFIKDSDNEFSIEEIKHLIRREIANAAENEDVFQQAASFAAELLQKPVGFTKRHSDIKVENGKLVFKFLVDQYGRGYRSELADEDLRFLIGEFKRFLLERPSARKTILLMLAKELYKGGFQNDDYEIKLATDRLRIEFIDRVHNNVIYKDENINKLIMMTELLMLDPYSVAATEFLEGKDFEPSAIDLQRIELDAVIKSEKIEV